MVYNKKQKEVIVPSMHGPWYAAAKYKYGCSLSNGQHWYIKIGYTQDMCSPYIIKVE